MAFENTHGSGGEELIAQARMPASYDSEGAGGNACASRAWKGNGCRGIPASRFAFHKHSAISTQHAAMIGRCVPPKISLVEC